MQRSVIEKFSGYPKKLLDLASLEEELYDVIPDSADLQWNRQRHCVEHRFSDEWEVEYAVLQHWSDHVGARFQVQEEPGRDGYFHAFIYR